jgi:phage FluMu gp28-like protein
MRTVTAEDLVERHDNPRSSPRYAPAADLLRTDPDDAVLLPYQQRLLASTAQVVVYEKSRRVGISWAAAAQAVLISAAASKAGGDDSFYIGFEKEMTRGFIDDCAFWAKHYGVAAAEAEEFVFVDTDPTGDKSIQAFRIRFASGFTIVALTSKPRNLRSRQGFVMTARPNSRREPCSLVPISRSSICRMGAFPSRRRRP